MRVALIVSQFPKVSETFAAYRVAALLDRGWDVHVLYETSAEGDWASFPELAQRPELRRRVHRRRRGPSRVAIAALFPALLASALVRAPVRTLRYLVRGIPRYRRTVMRRFVEDAPLIQLQPDIIHFEFGALVVGREATAALVGAALVVSFQGYDISYTGLDREPGYYEELWHSVDAVHFVSGALQERAIRRGFAPDGHGFVVPNGIDLKRFDAQGRAHSDVAGTQRRPVRLLSVGRLHWKKAYEVALQAVRSLVDSGLECEYRLVGDGEHKEALLFARDDLELVHRVRFLGQLPPNEVRPQMAWADVFVHPAVSEGFCVAVTEAQAMALPAVVSDAEGLAENVADGETGFVVARRDAGAIAERVALLARSPELRDRMGKAGVERVRAHFGLGAHVEGIERVYSHAVERHMRRAS